LFVQADVTHLEFSADSFDAVVMLEVLEHLNRQDGEDLLVKAQGWARKRVILSTPNGYLAQRALGGNPFQIHRSGWSPASLRAKGYRAYGLAGLHLLRSQNTADSPEEASSILGTIRWKPKPIWLIISEITQLLAYYHPDWSFEVFYVRDRHSNWK